MLWKGLEMQMVLQLLLGMGDIGLKHHFSHSLLSRPCSTMRCTHQPPGDLPGWQRTQLFPVIPDLLCTGFFSHAQGRDLAGCGWENHIDFMPSPVCCLYTKLARFFWTWLASVTSNILFSVLEDRVIVLRLRIPCKGFPILLSHWPIAWEEFPEQAFLILMLSQGQGLDLTMLFNLKCTALASKTTLRCCSSCQWCCLSPVRSVSNATVFSLCSKVSFRSSLHDGLSPTTSLPTCYVSPEDQREDKSLEKSRVRLCLSSDRAELHRWSWRYTWCSVAWGWHVQNVNSMLHTLLQTCRAKAAWQGSLGLTRVSSTK